ncbi:hypothetical protein [Thermogemmatispora onikobensis]|uniref:hypothetical protein n=1 Tax=Thermogemmatispora onikobensis TaxID=732234 RepID=UPI00159F050A|nr:hypothetical protein [Thermogemmatispora onikobensis]
MSSELADRLVAGQPVLPRYKKVCSRRDWLELMGQGSHAVLLFQQPQGEEDEPA